MRPTAQAADIEHNNLRVAARWLGETPQTAEHGLRLASGLVQYWSRRGYLGEGTTWLESALQREGPPSLARAWALRGLGGLRLTRDNAAHTTWASALLESAAMFALLGDSAGESRNSTMRKIVPFSTVMPVCCGAASSRPLVDPESHACSTAWHHRSASLRVARS